MTSPIFHRVVISDSPFSRFFLLLLVISNRERRAKRRLHLDGVTRAAYSRPAPHWSKRQLLSSRYYSFEDVLFVTRRNRCNLGYRFSIIFHVFARLWFVDFGFPILYIINSVSKKGENFCSIDNVLPTERPFFFQLSINSVEYNFRIVPDTNYFRADEDRVWEALASTTRSFEIIRSPVELRAKYPDDCGMAILTNSWHGRPIALTDSITFRSCI